MLEDLGLSSEKLEASGALEKMLSWQKSDLPPPSQYPTAIARSTLRHT